MWVAVAPGAAGKAASVGLEPSSSAVPITNSVRTVAGSSGASVSVHSNPDGSVVAAAGSAHAAEPASMSWSSKTPRLFTAGAFRDALSAAGVTVDGKIRVAQTPNGAIKVASLPSPPLARIVAAMNRESINHYAELLFRDAVRGPERETVGSAGLGAAMLQKFMTEQVGAAGDAVNVSDGSGLSTLDRITPRAMVDLLSYAHRSLWSAAFHASLPVAGESELLRNRIAADSRTGQPARQDRHHQQCDFPRRLRHGDEWRDPGVQLHLQRPRPMECQERHRRDGRNARIIRSRLTPPAVDACRHARFRPCWGRAMTRPVQR